MTVTLQLSLGAPSLPLPCGGGTHLLADLGRSSTASLAQALLFWKPLLVCLLLRGRREPPTSPPGPGTG